MTTPPGFSVPGVQYIGNAQVTGEVSIGRGDALTVDNATEPPTVSINGAPQQVTATVIGSISGLWAAPVAATVTLTRNGKLCTVSTPQAQASATVSDIRFFTFSPAIPAAFRPASTRDCLIQIAVESGFALMSTPGQMQVSPAGALTFWQTDLGIFADDTVQGFTATTSSAWEVA